MRFSLLILSLLLIFACPEYNDDVPCIDPTCCDGLDNDCDGLTDIEDTESCGDDGTGEFKIEEPAKFQCDDGIDNDGDGFIDDDDSDCGCAGIGEYTYSFLPVLNCDDAIDNDLDGLFDSADPDCGEDRLGEFEIPLILPANCDDAIDNDCDGLTDIEDTESCGEGGAGEILLPNCCDGIDNDDDGLIDALDIEACGIGGTGEVAPPLEICPDQYHIPTPIFPLEEGSELDQILDAVSSLDQDAIEEIKTCLVSLSSNDLIDLSSEQTQDVIENAIFESIRSVGGLPTCMETEEIDDLMESVAEDSTLSALLCSFSFEIPAGRLQRDDYEDCIAECVNMHNFCEAHYATCVRDRDICLSNCPPDPPYPPEICIDQAEEYLDGCKEKADVLLGSCEETANTVYTACDEQASFNFTVSMVIANSNVSTNMDFMMGNFNTLITIASNLFDAGYGSQATLVTNLALILLVNQSLVISNVYEVDISVAIVTLQDGYMDCDLNNGLYRSYCHIAHLNNITGCNDIFNSRIDLCFDIPTIPENCEWWCFYAFPCESLRIACLENVDDCWPDCHMIWGGSGGP